jgi:3-phytase
MRMPSTVRPALALGFAVLLLPGCALWRDAKEPDERAADEPRLAASDIAHEVVAEAFITPANPPDEVDSPTAWLTPEGGRWLISTGKETHQLLVHDGETGALLRRVGAKGAAPGQFNRPNGVFAWGDRLFVVERDNRRVQVLSLPGFTPLATFGEGELRSPYGLWLHEPEGGRIELWVTDSFMDGDDYDVVPPLEALSARIKRFSVLIDGDAVSARFDGASGDTASTASMGATRGATSASASSARRPRASRSGLARTAAATGSPPTSSSTPRCSMSTAARRWKRRAASPGATPG